MKDAFPAHPATLGGFVLRRAADGRSFLAIAALVDAVSLGLLATHSARMAIDANGDPTPVLLRALEGLPARPDIAIIEGHGTAEAGGEGLAIRFGAASDLPCIGVDTIVPPALQSRTDLHDVRGAFTALREGPCQVGWLLRSHVGAAPLVVSPGHRVALPSAPELVMRCVRDDRLPEPLRLALANLPG